MARSADELRAPRAGSPEVAERSRRLPRLHLPLLLAVLVSAGPALAQIVPDPTPGQLLTYRAQNPTEVERLEELDELDFPSLHDDPLAGSTIPPEKRDRPLFPWLMNLIVENPEHLRPTGLARAVRLNRQAQADILFPAPDTANFPNSAFTLPKGRAYLETSPLALYGPTRTAPPTYNWEFLLRYGLTDNLEFRLFSNGYTAQLGRNQTTGFSPLGFDLKMNFWEENLRYHVPAAGLEVYLQSTFGSPQFNAGTQPSLALLFDQTLPWDVAFEYNFSLTGTQTPEGDSDYDFGFQWAFQKSLTDDFAVFVHGFYNASNLPRIPNVLVRNLPGGLESAGEAVVVGAGGFWAVSDRWSIFGSYNAGLNPSSNTTIALLGLAVAF